MCVICDIFCVFDGLNTAGVGGDLRLFGIRMVGGGGGAVVAGR